VSNKENYGCETPAQQLEWGFQGLYVGCDPHIRFEANESEYEANIYPLQSE
jgi:hypothetical protein